MTIPNLLLIAGTGNKSGKTTFACRVIEKFRETGIFAIKITPHFHDTTPGLNLLISGEGFSIFEEKDAGSQKDTSRMLRSGASQVYFAKTTDNDLSKVFTEIINFIPAGSPIVCESPALRYYIEPGLFIIMMSGTDHNNKNINKLLGLPHVLIRLDDLPKMDSLPITFERGKWIYIR